MKKKYDAATLIAKYQNGTANTHERLLVEAFMLTDLEDDRVLPDEKHIATRTALIKEKLKVYIVHEDNLPKQRTLLTQTILRSPFIRAAAVLAIALGGILTALLWKNEPHSPITGSKTNIQRAAISPGSNKAYIITAEGQTIDLSQSKKTVRVGQDIAYEDGTVLWSPQHQQNTASINTLYTPKGGNYTVILSDGTKITLNAASRLSYPSRFSSEQRTVELEGEAFFEVRPSSYMGKKVPFLVKTRSQEIEVLGTSFNVKDYSDERSSKTTLIHGTVRVRLPNRKLSRLLSPGQEAIVYENTINTASVDTTAAVDWKNGLIYFNDETLANIMKKIERWYDVEVDFQNIDPNMRFGGSASKYKDLSDVLHRLELTGDVKFVIKGRRILVTK
ncbi:MAG: FecR family protein [Sphingobacterium sp.]